MPVAAAIPYIASAVSIVGGIRNMRNSGSAGQASQEGAAAADPFAQYRDQFAGQLISRFPDLVNLDPNAVRNDPAYQFEKEEGEGAINNMASSQGLLRSGNRLMDLSKFASGLAAKYSQNRLDNQLKVGNFLAMLSGASTGSPGAAGSILAGGANAGTNLFNMGLDQIGGGLSTFGRAIKPGSTPVNYTPGNPGYTGTGYGSDY